MEQNQSAERIKVKLKSPNPLFEKWLLEWHEENVTAGKIETIYSKALESLRKFPLVLNSGFECIILEHFDKQLCVKLAHKLDEYEATSKRCNEGPDVRNLSNGVRESENCLDVRKENTDNLASPKRSLKNKENKNKERKKIKKRVYIPMKRSAAYGILLGLLLKENEPNYAGFSTKAEVMTAAQRHTDVSMKKAVSGGFYTGWSSMSQLVSKGLVEKFSNPAKYKLTEEGRVLAVRLKSDCSIFTCDEPQDPILSLESASELIAPHKPRGRKNKIQNLNNCESTSSQGQDVMIASSQTEDKHGSCSQNHEFSEEASNSQTLSDNFSQDKKFIEGCGVEGNQYFPGSSSSQSQEFETQEMIFLPNNFEIILLIDSRETEGKEKKDESEILRLLEGLNIKFEVRGLKVGDFIWVARDCIGREMVLPYIIERKRFDDLSKSIKDGRFHEQKFRLKLCGLQNKIFLVENHDFQHTEATEYLYQAITNTMVCDKFTVRFSKNLKDTARYLSKLTQILKNTFQNKTLFSCKKDSVSDTIDLKDDIVSLLSYHEFSLDMEKTKELTAREDFALQLVQLKGMSSDKAWAITEVYPTPKCLIEGFLFGDAENVISELRSGLMKNKIGIKIASVLRTFYTSKEFSG
ncbi:crossover junction endonuclease MUS81 isoform X2 [Halyomorpha halys]|nr:crossover junction endonuclease MUS81 [Halyomorpha halys]